MRAKLEALNRPGTWLALAGAAVLAGLVTWGWRWLASRTADRSPPPVVQPGAAVSPVPTPAGPRVPSPPVVPGRPLTAAEKAERVKKILRDYEEIQAKMSADYGAAGRSFPGGLNAFLQQLALLEREKRADLAKVMEPRELEDFEIRETAAGQKMRTALDGTAATDEQRRGAFRAEQAFNEQYGFTFDVTPPALRAREAARQATQEQVRAALGDELFATWLQRDDPTYARAVAFAQQQNLPDTAALALWQVRAKTTLGALDIALAPPESAAAMRAALREWSRAQVTAIAPLVTPEAVDWEVANWLPPAQPVSVPRP